MIDFDKEISKKDFIKIIFKFILSISVFSMIPIKSFANKSGQLFKMKVTKFKREYLFKNHKLAG